VVRGCRAEALAATEPRISKCLHASDPRLFALIGVYSSKSPTTLRERETSVPTPSAIGPVPAVCYD